MWLASTVTGGEGSSVGSVSGSGLTHEPADADAVLRTICRPGPVTALTGRVGNGPGLREQVPGALRHPPGKCVPTLEPVCDRKGWR